MRKRIVLMLLTFACSLMFSEAKAAVDSTAQVSYYEPTNSIWAYAQTCADYETLLYYDVSQWGYLRKDDVPVSDVWGEADFSFCAGWSAFSPYDPNADYAIEVYPTVHLIYRHSPGDTYADYYNYVQWTYATQVYAPYSFGFTGPGPDVGISFSDILLGYVFSIFTDGGTSGPPHHLKVITDNEVIRNDLCGQIEKRIQFQVVDQQNRAAGQVALDEKPANLTDTCTGTTVGMSTCATSSSNTYGNFTDVIRTGCPHTGPTPCGFDFFNRWRWCRNTSPYTPPNQVDLAFMYYWATRTFVKIDNETDIQDLSYKYP